MASTITRFTWTNDTGTPAAPVGDGTVINNAQLQLIFDRIDQLFSGAGAYTTLEIGGLLKVDGFGLHQFAGGGTGGHALGVRNTSAGTGNYADVRLGNNGAADAAVIRQHSSTFTTSTYSRQDGLLIASTRVGSITLASLQANPIQIIGPAGEDGAPAEAGDKRATLRIMAASISAGQGGSVEFGNVVGNNAKHFASIKGHATDATNNTLGELRVYTRAASSDAALTERLRVTGAQLLVGDGSASLPARAFLSDPDTGFYSAGADILGIALGGVAGFTLSGGPSTNTIITMVGRSVSGGSGARLNVQGNTSGSGAPGVVVLHDRSANNRPIWVDASGNVRVDTSGTVPTTVTGDLGGTVVGTQTSRRETKTDIRRFTAIDEALALICATPLHRFRYRSGAYGGTEFVGILADEAPAFVMDPDATGLGRSFNPVSAFGYSAAAIQALAARVAALEAR